MPGAAHAQHVHRAADEAPVHEHQAREGQEVREGRGHEVELRGQVQLLRPRHAWRVNRVKVPLALLKTLLTQWRLQFDEICQTS